jgi:hypothetical protein
MITKISGRVKLCMDAAENTSWGLANKGKIFGLEKRKQSNKINKQQCLPFYMLFLCLKYISQCCNFFLKWQYMSSLRRNSIAIGPA